MTADTVWVPEGVLTLPYGTLRTLHVGVSEVRVYSSALTQTKQVGKRVSLLGREGHLAVSEVTILRQIDHPNVARVFDVAEPAGADSSLGVVEIMMPYYEDGSVLDAMLEGRRFGLVEARDLVVRALRGVSHLHRKHSVLHRDLKPGNLFLSGDETLLKVGDFGEAVRMDESRTAEPLLTPQYWTPPETFTGERYAEPSEVYSLGMSFMEMLSGPFPYDSYTREQLGERLSEGRMALRPKHFAFMPHVSQSLRKVVRKSTRRKPEDGFASADAMIAALLRARFVDWGWPVESTDAVIWSGSWKGQLLRVRCRPIRRKGWRARAEKQHGASWRKLPQADESDAADPFDAAARVFSQIDKAFEKL